MNGIGSVAGVAGGLIDADGKGAIDGSEQVAFSADEKHLGGVLVADACDNGAASRFVVGKHTNEIAESAVQALRAIVFLGVEVAELAFGGDEDVLAGLNVHTGIKPRGFACELQLLREALLAWGGGAGGFALRGLGHRSNVVADQLRSRSRGEEQCEQGDPAGERSQPQRPTCRLRAIQ